MNDLINETLFVNIRYIVEFVSYFVFAFTSSLLKEVYSANTIHNYRFAPYRVICSTILATIGTVALKEIYSQELDGLWGTTAFISTVFGLLGFEIFKHLTSIKGIKTLLKEVKDIKESAEDLNDENNKNQMKKELYGKSIHHMKKKDND